MTSVPPLDSEALQAAMRAYNSWTSDETDAVTKAIRAYMGVVAAVSVERLAALLEHGADLYDAEPNASRPSIALFIAEYLLERGTFLLGALPRSPLPPEPSELNALRAFFWLCWDGARGMALPSVDDLDGGDIQEWGVKCGLLQKVVATAPCGEGCVCADYVGDDFPTDCYRPTVVRPALHNKEQKP